MRHIPNILSIVRIILIPIFVLQMKNNQTDIAGFVLILSGFTDFLDGQLARKYQWVSKVGQVLDPLADKLTQIVVSIVLAYRFSDYWYLFLFMIIKEILMMIFSCYLIVKKAEFNGANWYGKVATFVYYFAMILIVLIPNLDENIVFGLLIVATVFVVIALSLYIPEFFKSKKTIENHN